ncbi:sigma-70 family RNA polymerase sigma factor [Inquilinus limosus]|uniref:sigma-70 family RNA polymerase sigma factor n=1 Tax=Inquilinus limosus TaxID=171674 RepID=UPI003F13EE7D
MAEISPTTRQTFIAEVLPHIAELRRYAYALTRNCADADDLLQDTMARALVKLHLWEAGTRMVPWLTVMMRNICRSAYGRAWSKVQWCELAEFDSVAPAPQLDTIELKEAGELWSRMPDHHREVLEIVALDGLSYEDAADRLKIPVGTVRSRLSRARDSLRAAVIRDEVSGRTLAQIPGLERRRPPALGRTNRQAFEPADRLRDRKDLLPRVSQRVMLVEDDFWLAGVLEKFVREVGLEVVGPVGRLQDAIDLATSEPIDAAVLDIRLDRDTVYPVADILEGKEIPFAFVTALAVSDTQGVHQGRPIWNKPIDRRQFQRDLRVLLEGPAIHPVNGRGLHCEEPI